MSPTSFQAIKKFEYFLAHILETFGEDSVVDSLSFLDRAFVLSLDGVLLAANDEFADLVGYSREELMGINVTQLVVPKERESLRQKLSNHFKRTYRLNLLTKSTAVKHVIVTPCIFESAGKVYRLAGFSDHTDVINLKNNQIHHLRSIANTLIRALEVRDPYTIGHMSRSARMSVKIAQSFKLTPAAMDALEIGAELHDVGKSAIPIEILTKPGKLEPYEWAFIKKHPEIGHKILSGVDLDKISLDIVLLHHECWDGSGYPYGLKRDEIPLESAIVHAADSLDAIAGVRPYRKAYSFDEAIQIMEGMEGKYHPEVLAVCGRLVKSGAFSGQEYNPLPLEF